MPDFAIIYHAGKMPDSPEEGAKHQQKWQDWINDLGDDVINPGTPFGESKIVSSDGVTDPGDRRIQGFCMVRADDLDAAIEIAKGDPFLTFGKVQVAQVMSMG